MSFSINFLLSFIKITNFNSVEISLFTYRGSFFFDMALTVLWQSIALKHPMYERICASLFLGDGGSKTVDWKLHKFTTIYLPSEKLTQVPRTTKSHSSHGWRHHVHLLKVYETIYASFITFMCKRHIFQQQRHEGNDWRLQFTHRHPTIIHRGTILLKCTANSSRRGRGKWKRKNNFCEKFSSW